MESAKPKRTRRKAAPADAEAIAAAAETPVTLQAPLADAAAPVSEAIELEIRRRAYEIYLSRGEIGGDELTDWLEAERDIRLRRESGNGQISSSL